MKKKISLVCEKCGKTFERIASEHKRNCKKGRRIYCGLSCLGKDTIKQKIKHGKRSHKHLKSNNRLDELSPFRYHMKNIRMHCKKGDKNFSISLQDLKEQWEKQNGICPYTGQKMVLYHKSKTYEITNALPYRASVDRKDSSKGYTKDNIEFVSYMANIAKNRFSKEELIDFCKKVSENHS